MIIKRDSLIRTYELLKVFFKGYKNLQMVTYKLDKDILIIQAFRGNTEFLFKHKVELEEMDMNHMVSVKYINMIDMLSDSKEVRINISENAVYFRIDDTEFTATQKFSCEYVDSGICNSSGTKINNASEIASALKKLMYSKYMNGIVSVCIENKLIKLFQVNSYSEINLRTDTGIHTIIPAELIEILSHIITNGCEIEIKERNTIVKNEALGIYLGMDNTGSFFDVIPTEDIPLFETNNMRGIINTFRKCGIKEVSMHTTKDSLIIESIKHDLDLRVRKVIKIDKIASFNFNLSTEELFGALTFLDGGNIKVYTFGDFLLMKDTTKSIVIWKVDN